MMNDKQQHEYWQVYVDAWSLFRFYLDHGLSDSAMERLMAVARNLNAKYESVPFAQHIIQETLQEIGRISKEEWEREKQITERTGGA